MSDLQDLNDHLFAQLDRLSSGSLSGDELEQEVKRAGAIVEVAYTIVDNNRLRLSAAKLFAEHGQAILPHLPQIGHKKAEQAE